MHAATAVASPSQSRTSTSIQAFRECLAQRAIDGGKLMAAALQHPDQRAADEPAACSGPSQANNAPCSSLERVWRLRLCLACAPVAGDGALQACLEALGQARYIMVRSVYS
jgi:hypothetical protein